MVDNDFPKEAAYAVIRLDLFLESQAPVSEVVTVKEILPTSREADEEVARLNASVDPRQVLYVVQPTRYYPNGRRRTGTGLDDEAS